LVDQTDGNLVKQSMNKGSTERILLDGLRALNIFSVVGPLSKSKNVLFEP
jgi:hypothetical protein